jgi:hypothetical protein
MKNYRTIAVFGIPYLTFCAGLYHIAYWGTFDINGLAYIGLSDLVKSFVHPCLYFFAIALLSFILNEGILNLGIVFPYGGGRDTPTGRKLNSKWARSILLLLWLYMIFMLYSHGDAIRWLFWAFTVAIVPILVLDNLGLWKNDFEDYKLRVHAIRILVFLPVLSFASGKYQGELIFKNLQYQYTTSDTIIPNANSSKPDTLKFLGNAGDFFLLTDLTNTRIVFVKNDILTITQFQKK